MTCIILQARLDSTRLPQKALLDLAGRPIIVRVMENLRRIPADCYVLACDTASESVLAPLASSCGFSCISGPKDDVLERFCIVIRATGAKTVLRATGDNPYLFADAAGAALARFAELRSAGQNVDYFTWSGLPHGSGIEVFSARRLLEAAALTDSSYDREHVGPSLYNHTDRFNCVRETPKHEWYHPEMRTTVDTPEDYENACLLSERLAEKGYALPVSSQAVVDAWRYVSHPILFVPSIAAGQGTGHIRRLAALVETLRDKWRCLFFIPLGTPFASLIPGSILSCVVRELPSRAHLVILDYFRTSKADMEMLRAVGPVAALDEGGNGRSDADYLLDIIPGIPGTVCKANLASPEFLPLPVNRKQKTSGSLATVLVLSGGENTGDLAMPAAEIIAASGLQVTVIDPSYTGVPFVRGPLTVTGPIPGLRETLLHYDLVVTHFGFTAFEALAAGCSVILFSPTKYHYRLGRANGFSVTAPGCFSAASFDSIRKRGILTPKIINVRTAQADLSEKIGSLASRSVRSCPLCGNEDFSVAVARYPDRTVSACPVCGMRYLSFLVAGEQQYAKSYFFDEYREQYGKTYLEDFDAIKSTGLLRISVIDECVSRGFRNLCGTEKKILDIGCAYGPFLSAARDARWLAYGTDIAPDAVQYVCETLRIPAVVSAFPATESPDFFPKHGFLAVTLWYVIEHFEDLEPVLSRIRDLLIPGGIFAFSTPSASGVSGRFKRESFYRQSPRDHYTLWDPLKVSAQLERYGFKVVRIVSTGHHCERFPGLGKIRPHSRMWKFGNLVSKFFGLGDTFEVYAFKKGTLEDVE